MAPGWQTEQGSIGYHEAMAANHYWILRHAESLANVEGIIVSKSEIGTQQYGLSPRGREGLPAKLAAQVAAFMRTSPSVDATADLGAANLGAADLGADTLIVSSDFLRARETAGIAASVLKAASPRLDPALRERDFGDLDGKSDREYPAVWALDAAHSASYPNGIESPAAVRTRLVALIKRMEEAESGRTILLVSHGDTLQILQTCFAGLNAHRHRELPHLDKGELRYLGAWKERQE